MDLNLKWNDKDDQVVKLIRSLTVDSVENANSGHPGTALSLAPIGYLLFHYVLKHSSRNPSWIARDRFILSCGHASLLLYVNLFLSGYQIALDDLRTFRSTGSKVAGHPEYKSVHGIEVTTGPLGQGFANAVGMAMASRYERGLYDPNTAKGESIFDHYIYALASDGDLEEGISSEASSLAGHQELDNLIVIYDNNHISIEGNTDRAFTEDVRLRYEAYNWHVQHVSFLKDDLYYEDVTRVYDAICNAKKTSQPSLIILDTIIGYPAPTLQNKSKVHGSPLGAEEAKALKNMLGYGDKEPFYIDNDILSYARNTIEHSENEYELWLKRYNDYLISNPNSKLHKRILESKLPDNWESDIVPFQPSQKGVSTRVAFGKVMNMTAKYIQELWGGSADLAPSNNTDIDNSKSFLPNKYVDSDKYGRIVHFGVREHAMASIMNGILAHGSTRFFAGTFLIFSDYMRGAIRLTALMDLPAIYIWTHDSIGLGEDGPTHQPIEHLASLRAIINLYIVRPADANEVLEAWKYILQFKHPVGFVLSRQNLPVIDRDKYNSAINVYKGAYILKEESNKDNFLILMSSGSEVSIALEASEILENAGIPTRVISFICFEWFEDQTEEYKEGILPMHINKRISIEAAVADSWARYLFGNLKNHIGMNSYGASGKCTELYNLFNITVNKVVEKGISICKDIIN